MVISELRKRHPRFVYDSYTFLQKANQLHISFTFILEPALTFTPRLVIPLKNTIREADIAPLVFHVGLIEALSYWKLACSPEFIVNAGYLSTAQIKWWRDLFLYGLGEFYYKNKIDFTKGDFLSITSANQVSKTHRITLSTQNSGELVLVGGGKDSIVTLELLKTTSARRNVFVLNPTPAMRHILSLSKYNSPLIGERTIDPLLLKLNASGYLNGHTPFSAYLAFLGLLTGVVHSFEYIIASNERSSEETNVTYRNIKVNHQYSKTYRFESRFREYCRRHLSTTTSYFSFLRPLFEFQIMALFVKYPRYFNAFISCNRNRGRSWCGNCAKCAFIYLTFFPFLTIKLRRQIFSKDFFGNSLIRQYITDLVGLGRNKPFECVGTEIESKKAVHLAYENYRANSSALPAFITTLHKKLLPHVSSAIINKWLRYQWSDKHFLPARYAAVLRTAIENL